MQEKYKIWIAKNVPKECRNQCAKYTEQMDKAFPELTRVRGHYYCAFQGERQHWWLIDEEGEVVDPTASQFPSKGIGFYDIWDETQEEPTGKCPNCGDYCYKGRHVCSDSCEVSYIAYINNSLN